jgi:hypothetical protein
VATRPVDIRIEWFAVAVERKKPEPSLSAKQPKIIHGAKDETVLVQTLDLKQFQAKVFVL